MKFNPNENIQFEFLATMVIVEKSIIHVIKIHEEHYYKKNIISTSPEFLNQLKDWIQVSLIEGDLKTEDLLSLIKDFEMKSYKANKFKIFDEDESIYGIIDDLFSLVNVAIIDKNLTTINDVNDVESECQHLLANMNASWIYQDSGDSWLELDISITINGLNEILEVNGKDESPWRKEEDLILDLEKFISKTWDLFDYPDKLKSFNYIQQLDFLKGLTGRQREDLLDQFHTFLGL